MRYTLFLIAVGLVGALAGCSPSSQQEAQHVGQDVKKDTQHAAQTVQKDVAEGTTTLRVKTALSDSAGLKGSHISVSTETHTVVLRGTVLSEAQKGLADRIVRDTLGKGTSLKDETTLEKRAAQAGH